MSTPDWGRSAVLTADTDLLGVGPLTLAQGASATYPVNITNPGYTIRLELWNSTDNTTSLPVNVDVIWADRAYNIGIDRQTWWVQAGQASNTHLIRGHGPTVGDQMQITLTNKAASAVTLTYKINVVGRSITYAVHDWRTNIITGGVYPGFTAAPCDPMAGIVAMESALAVGAGTTTTLLLPLFAGRATFGTSYAPSVGSNVQISNAADQLFALNGIMFMIGLTTTLFAEVIPVVLPRAQCTVQFNNYSANPTTFTLAITADQA